MSVLILKNTPTEGPGTLGTFLEEQGVPTVTVDLSREALPDGSAFDTLVMLGGPMSVNDEHIYPYLKPEMELAARFMKSGKRVFGICLGAQLMAKALGAPVYPGAEKEIGWYSLELTEEGRQNPFMKTLCGGEETRCDVFHWHGETFDIPAGAERLARSALYPNQAFRFGERSYAFQFHIEVTKAMIIDWLSDEPIDQVMLKEKTDSLYGDYLRRAKAFYKVFFFDA